MPDTKKILLIDDDPGLSTTFGLGLESAGFELIVAKDGKEGMQKAVKERPDLIITDLMMPAVDGKDFLKELVNHPECKGTPVLVMSALVAELERDEILRLGAKEYLEKTSTSPDMLVEKAKKYT